MTGLWDGHHPRGWNIWEKHTLERIDLFRLVVFAGQNEGGDAAIEYRAGDIFEHAFLGQACLAGVAPLSVSSMTW
jgi:hypothetical protein